MLVPSTIIASGGDNGVHLAADLKEVYWGSAAFVVLLLIVLWKGTPAILKAMRGRAEKIRSEIEEAGLKRQEAEDVLSTGSQSLPDIGQERSRIRREAIETAEQLKHDLLIQAAEEARSIRSRGHDDIDKMKRQAVVELESQVATLTRETTEVVVKDALTGSSQSDLVDSYIREIATMNKVGQSV